MNYPTKETVELGMKLVASTERSGGGPQIVLDIESPEAAEEAKAQAAAFNFPQFLAFRDMMHGHLHHGPLAFNCDTQKMLLTGVIAKMFFAGWMAGRQEVMDLTFEKATKEAEGQG